MLMPLRWRCTGLGRRAKPDNNFTRRTPNMANEILPHQQAPPMSIHLRVTSF
eukprot:c37619_g1_i1 orf=561-716(-)